MARGFLGGIVFGAIVSIAGAALLSVLSYPPASPTASVDGPTGVAAPDPGEAASTEAVTDADLVRDDDPPQVVSPSADDATAVAAAGSDTAPIPQTGRAEDLSGPAEVAEAGAVDVDSDVPVLPSSHAVLPGAPDSEGVLSISTDPAQPPAPSVPETETAFALDVETAPEVPAAEDPAPDITPAPTPTPDAPTAAEAPVEPEAPEAPETPVAEAPAPEEVPDTPVAEVPAPVEAPDTPVAEVPAPEELPETPVAEAPEPEDAPQSPITEAPVVEETPEVAALPEESPADPSRVGIGRPATSLVDSTPEAPDTSDTTDEAAPPSDLPPLQAYASAFENPDDKPLMSIILMDTGADLASGPVGLAALRSFPYPLTFAVDALLPDAAERAADYRSQGFEVMALLDLPQGATAGDAEVALSVALETVQEAVGVMEGVRTGVQVSREASDQLTEALLSSGHGFVLQSKGLNTAQKLAARAGVPAGLVFRDFDSAGQTPTVIRRFLDQAAFRAGQEGGVIMVGRLRPDTISALLLWGLQDRAQRVALAPVSAVLTTLAAAEAQ